MMGLHVRNSFLTLFFPCSLVLLFYPPSSAHPTQPSPYPLRFVKSPSVCVRESEESIADADKFTDKREGSVYTPSSLFLGVLLARGTGAVSFFVSRQECKLEDM